MPQLDCNVIDAGARYGLHPSWQSMETLVNFFLFEADDKEVNRLKKKYIDRKNITVENLALFSKDTTLTFKERHHRALNSHYDINEAFLSDEDYMRIEHENIREYTVEARSIDSLFSNQEIHFLKIDTEGAELEVLNGAKSKIMDTVLGVRAEVPFAPILKDCPTFGEINNFMYEHGFELLNLDYDGRGSARSPFTLPDKFGKLMSTDGVWVISSKRLFDRTRNDVAPNTIRMALFLMLNNATDVALEVLLRAVEKEGVSYATFINQPLFRDLNKRVALLFKAISYLPSMEKNYIQDAYKKIFGLDFPVLNDFYESSLFD